MSNINAVSHASHAAMTVEQAAGRALSAAPRRGDSVVISAQAETFQALSETLSVEGGYDEASALLFARVVDVVTGRTVHQVPRQELLDLYARFREFSQMIDRSVNPSESTSARD